MKASPSALVDLETVLAEVPLFSVLDEEELTALSSLAERQDLRSGARLYKEGEASTHCYVVVRGRLQETSDGELLGYIGRLEPVGEIGILMGEPRTSTVRAVRDSILLRFQKAELLDFLDHHPSVQRALSRLMVVRVREQGREQHAILAVQHLVDRHSQVPQLLGGDVIEEAERLGIDAERQAELVQLGLDRELAHGVLLSRDGALAPPAASRRIQTRSRRGSGGSAARKAPSIVRWRVAAASSMASLSSPICAAVRLRKADKLAAGRPSLAAS